MGMGGVGMQAAGNLLQNQLNPQNQVDKAKAEAYLKGFKGGDLSPWEKAVTGYDPVAMAAKQEQMKYEQNKREHIQKASELLASGDTPGALKEFEAADPQAWAESQLSRKPADSFTLGEGQTRFDANGNPIASVAKGEKVKKVWGVDKSGKMVELGEISKDDEIRQLESADPETENIYSFDESSKKMVLIGQVPKGSKVVVKEAPAPQKAPYQSPGLQSNLEAAVKAITSGADKEKVYQRLASKYPNDASKIKTILYPDSGGLNIDFNSLVR
jgi:hypothetical protein